MGSFPFCSWSFLFLHLFQAVLLCSCPRSADMGPFEPISIPTTLPCTPYRTPAGFLAQQTSTMGEV